MQIKVHENVTQTKNQSVTEQKAFQQSVVLAMQLASQAHPECVSVEQMKNKNTATHETDKMNKFV